MKKITFLILMMYSIASFAQTTDTLNVEQLKSKILSMQNDIASLKISANHSIDAGFELENASREHFTGILLCIVGSGISTLYALAPQPSGGGVMLGGGLGIIGVGYIISSWIHIGRAGKVMQRKKT